MPILSSRRSMLPLVAAIILSASIPTATFAADSDHDGLSDAFEKRYGLTNHMRYDSDRDGVSDGDEDLDGDDLSNLGEQRFGTHPGRRDTDRDGKHDGLEDHDRDGKRNRLEQHQRRVPANLQPTLDKAKRDVAPQGARCSVKNEKSDPITCDFGDLGSSTTVVLMGDSKATAWLPPTVAAAKHGGWHLVSLLKSRCAPLLSSTTSAFQYKLDRGRSCAKYTQRALDRLAADPPDLLVMTFSDSYKLTNRWTGKKVTGQARRKALREAVTRTVQALPPETRVVLLRDTPTLTKSPVGCLKKHPKDMSACLSRQSSWATAGSAAIRGAAIASGVDFRSLNSKVCPHKPCPLVAGRTLVYRDQGHLTVTFTKRLTPSVRALISSELAKSP